MRDSQLQTPQKDHAVTNHRSKPLSDRNKKLQKVSKKNLNSAFSSFTEDILGFESPKVSIDSSSITETSEENLLAESAEDFSVSLTPASAIASEAVASSEISPLSSIITSEEPKDGTASTSQYRAAKQESMKISSVEVEVVLKSLREAQFQALKAKNMDLHSKRLLDALVNIFVEELIQLPVEKDRFNEIMSKRGYLVVLCFLLWTLAVFAVLFNSSHSRISSIGAIPT